MKNTSFGALLYREFLLTKKNTLMTIFSVTLFIVVCLLISLSTQIGNLSKAEDGLKDLFLTTRLMGIYCSAFLIFIAGEATAKDEISKPLKLFRKSSPVSPWKLSLVKYTYYFIAMAVSIAFAGIYLMADSAITGKAVEFSDFAMLAFMLAAALLLQIALSVALQFSGSKDKAGIAMVVIVFSIMVPAMTWIQNNSIIPQNATPKETLEIIRSLSLTAFPFVCMIIAALYVIGFVVTALLYKRREK